MSWRIFLTCWIVFTIHFATSVVREHYPAFSLVEDGSLQLDDYAGFHADIFEHEDGHHYIGNQVAGSFIAAVPLLVFDPVLDWLEEARQPVADDPLAHVNEYESEYKVSAEFFRKVRARGLDLRFGGATVVTSAFLMAPLCAWLVVLMYQVLLARGIARDRAVWLALLFAFATPIFYRSAHLNHNVFVTVAVFGSFLLMWPRPDVTRLSAPRRFWAGFAAGGALALDYVGVVTLLALFGYLLWRESRSGGVRAALGAAPAFVLGSVPPVLFLLYTQWSMFGDPFVPGQFWMKNQNAYVDDGMRGMTLPDPELFFLNLVHPSWGMYAFAPLLAVGLLPTWRYAADSLVLPRRERTWVAAFFLVFAVFCSCNQYSRLQWNTGFRYLLPLVPFAFLQASDHLRRMPTRWLAALTIPVVLHGWVISMVRYTPPFAGDASAIPETWRRFLSEGPQLPWLKVATQTQSLPFEFLRWSLLPTLVLLATAVPVAAIWLVRRPAADKR